MTDSRWEDRRAYDNPLLLRMSNYCWNVSQSNICYQKWRIAGEKDYQPQPPTLMFLVLRLQILFLDLLTYDITYCRRFWPFIPKGRQRLKLQSSSSHDKGLYGLEKHIREPWDLMEPSEWRLTTFVVILVWCFPLALPSCPPFHCRILLCDLLYVLVSMPILD